MEGNVDSDYKYELGLGCVESSILYFGTLRGYIRTVRHSYIHPKSFINTCVPFFNPPASGSNFAKLHGRADMSNRGSWKDSEGDYLLVISGTTRHAPFLAGWRNFKDHIRNVVKEQPGWADVYPSQSHRRGEMQGWARLKLPEDTDSTYSMRSSFP